ncbi:MAG: GTP-binding protein [Clostridia bacterium]|nr:GTP-binding protein [Clostridia bacterium]
MTKIDIFSGFLGAGKTTLIKKLIAEAYCGEKLVLIENEFGDIGIDGGFLQDAGVNITEMNSGCICCSLVGDFGEALKQVLRDYAPDRILIEPSGVGKLSDVIRAVQDIHSDDIVLNGISTVADVNKCKMYMKNFGEFFNNQIEFAHTIILSHTTGTSDAKLNACTELLREHNPDADILTTPWEQLTGAQILEVIEKKHTLEDELKQLADEVSTCPVCGHHHDHEHHHEHDGHCCCEHDHEHHHEHDEHCCCGHDHEHHHEHDEHCCCEHDHEHHHEHDEHCCCEHDHEHHHEHDEHCCCGHDHEHHHHHHADEVFTSFGAETGRRYTADEITAALNALADEEKYGVILRAKGIVSGTDGFIHFDYVPGEPDVRSGSAAPTGRLCIIGAQINEDALKELFML